MPIKMIDTKGAMVTTASEDGVYLHRATGADAYQAIVVGPMRFTPGKLARVLSEREGKSYLVQDCYSMPIDKNLQQVHRRHILERGFWVIVLVAAEAAKAAA